VKKNDLGAKAIKQLTLAADKERQTSKSEEHAASGLRNRVEAESGSAVAI
jgi:hypothetical protein